jgi:hypothetical protein
MVERCSSFVHGRATCATLAQVVGALLLSAAALPASAGPLGGYIPPVGGSQLMLFISRPITPGSPANSTWGLRYERASPVASASSGPYCAPLRHRTLIELQLAHGSTPRLMFGRNVGWDIERGQFGSMSSGTSLRTLFDRPSAPHAFILP